MLPENFMRQALDLARAGIGLASPNPCVGAVLVDDQGQVIGTGTHTYAGVKHAEVLAVEAAAQRGGKRARGATLYINLEPCSHQGRTGPCADALIAAGVKRVVAAMEDPNPRVSGQGFAKLRAAGIQVDVGLCAEDATRLNEAFTKYIRTGTPLVTLKAAMTLDGKIAPPPTEPQVPGIVAPSGGWITSEAARAHVQLLRHEHDAILVGVGTIVADDPLLTDRSGLPRRRKLLRLIVDSRLRLPHDSRIVRTAEDDVMVLCSFAEEKKKQALQALGIRVEQVPGVRPDSVPDLRGVMQRLGELQITSLLIEGGAKVNWAALVSGVVDKVFLYYAPKILAGTGSIPFAGGDGFMQMSDAAQVKNIRLHRFGEDFAVEGYLR